MDVDNAVTSAAFRGLMGMTAPDEARKPLPEMTVRQLLPFPFDPVNPASLYDDLPSAGTRPTHRELRGQDPGLAARGRLRAHGLILAGGGVR